MAQWDAKERDRIEFELNQNLGPELVNVKENCGEFNAYFLSIHQVFSLANDIFGYDNWKAEVKWDSLDHVYEEGDGAQKLFVAEATCCVRVALRSGSYHEDIGTSHAKGSSKSEAINKAKSIAKSDATKRAFRQFGQALGNCLYDNEYTGQLVTLTSDSQS